MSNVVTLNKFIDEEFFDLVTPENYLTYYFRNEENERIDLEAIEENGVVAFEDNSCQWEFRYSGLYVEGNLYLKNVHQLFGVSGYVVSDATIGVGLRVASHKSNQQTVKEIGEITAASPHATMISYEQYIDKNKFYHSFTLEFFLYIKQAGTQEIAGFINVPGMMLGTLDNVHIDIDGAMSNFPIQKIHAPHKPLWFVEMDIEDATINRFEPEYVCIYFNTAHAAFKYLEKNNHAYSEFLQTEVMASALTLIIAHLMTLPEWSDIYNGKNLTEGSIGAAVHYFKTALEWDFTDTFTLSESIRLYFQGLGATSNE